MVAAVAMTVGLAVQLMTIVDAAVTAAETAQCCCYWWY